MEKTIYNVFIKMESQEQCDRMKQICINNGLDYEKDKGDFNFLDDGTDVFRFSNSFKAFSIWDENERFERVTEKEFIELLKNK